MIARYLLCVKLKAVAQRCSDKIDLLKIFGRFTGKNPWRGPFLLELVIEQPGVQMMCSQSH